MLKITLKFKKGYIRNETFLYNISVESVANNILLKNSI